MDDERRRDPATIPNLPADRTFVVQFRAAPNRESIDHIPHGRVEHLVSGRATHFDTWLEFELFVERVLLAAASPSPDVSRRCVP